MSKHAAPFNVSHFSVNAHDVARAAKFYGTLFGWSFEPWGPPGFFLISTGDGIHGALQGVQDEPVPTRVGAFECTLSVDDVDRILAEVEANGGTVQAGKVTIPGVGDIARVVDPEGNVFCIAKYVD